ncbi:hypothetical protein TSAR_011375 [Trichomalopsis sarcophagae]|uniref:Uncharacterized protein n=1 Tax=Trichomalopsis sarcophagae TaxID=543379 RepID=A0A232EFV3_9HYME|nr:hypothetical protein TSAR_011375 [Trichomalopsis sarcophagae]
MVNSSCTRTASAHTRLFLFISLTQAYSMPRSSLSSLAFLFLKNYLPGRCRW